MAESAPEARSDWALRRLRNAILPGEFPPGTKLRAEDLAARWQLSPTPLREALRAALANAPATPLRKRAHRQRRDSR